MLRPRNARILFPALTFLLVGVAILASRDGARSEEAYQLPLEKQQALDRAAAFLSEAAKSGKTIDPSDRSTWPDWLTTSPASVVPGASAGAGQIYDDPVADLMKNEIPYAVTNRWTDGKEIVVFAGYMKADPDQGIALFANEGAAGKADIRSGLHKSPIKAGGLKVVGADGWTLQLQSASGVEFLFDAMSGRFTSPVEEPLPTPSPAPTPSPSPPPAGRLFIDADTEGNSPVAWGAVDSCATMRAGDSRSVDLIVQGLPQAKDGSTAGIVGFSVTLNFDPAVVRATSTNGKMLLDTVTGANPASFSEPDVEPGRYIVSIADLGPTGEGGAAAIVARSDGVLARITFEGVGPGSTGIEMTNAGIIDEFNDAHAPAAIEGARLAVDAACQ